MTAATKDTLHSQMEHLQMKHVGTGHADTSKFEWLSNIHRDSIASYIGHAPLLSYFSVALNQSAGRTRHQLLQKMVMPVGPAPPPEDESAPQDDAMVE